MKSAPVRKANEGALDSANSTTNRVAIEISRIFGTAPPDFVLFAALVCVTVWRCVW